MSKKEPQLVPMQDFLVLEEILPESKSKIIIIENADLERTNQAKVIAKGPDVTLDVNVDDTVFIKHYGFEELTFGGKKLLLGRQENIYAIVK